MSPNLSANGYVLTHCLEPEGPAFSGETQCKELDLGRSLEKSDHHFMKALSVPNDTPSGNHFWICETDIYFSRDNQITLS